MLNNDKDFLGEYMTECPRCHHRYNKDLHRNKCPDCGYRKGGFLKYIPYIIVVMFIILMLIYPKLDAIIDKISSSDKLQYLHTRVALLNPIYTLIGINIILFVFGWNANNAHIYGNSYETTIKQRQFYRLITSGFTHADILHILCNMWTLYNIGTFAYSILGLGLFLLLYFISLILGGLLSTLLHHMNGKDDVFSIGASGAICGLLGFYSIFIVKLGIDPAIFTEALYKAFAPLFITIFNPRVDNLGHLCGLIIGILFALLLLY